MREFLHVQPRGQIMHISSDSIRRDDWVCSASAALADSDQLALNPDSRLGSFGQNRCVSRSPQPIGFVRRESQSGALDSERVRWPLSRARRLCHTTDVTSHFGFVRNMVGRAGTEGQRHVVAEVRADVRGRWGDRFDVRGNSSRRRGGDARTGRERHPQRRALSQESATPRWFLVRSRQSGTHRHDQPRDHGTLDGGRRGNVPDHCQVDRLSPQLFARATQEHLFRGLADDGLRGGDARTATS